MTSHLCLRNESLARSLSGRVGPDDVNGATNSSPEYDAAHGAQKSAVVLGKENTSGVLLARPPSEERNTGVFGWNVRPPDATAKLTTSNPGTEEATGQVVITTYYQIAMVEAAWRYFVTRTTCN